MAFIRAGDLYRGADRLGVVQGALNNKPAGGASQAFETGGSVGCAPLERIAQRPFERLVLALHVVGLEHEGPSG